jgi:probable F420-dependent oxidoreductase
MATIKIERVLRTPDDAPIPGGLASTAPWATLTDQVKAAEELGYDSVLAVAMQHDPYMILAVAAQQPSRLELCTGVALAFVMSPVETAYIARDLHQMSGGRLNLGLGSQVKGHITRRFSMPWSKPAQRMKDYVGALRACWHSWDSGEPIDYRSEHYNVSLMVPNLTPPRLPFGAIPVMIAAVQERMLQVAGETGDGARLHGFVTRRYLDEIAFPNLKKGFAKSGRSQREWDQFEISGGGFVCAAADADALAVEFEKVRKQISFYASTRSYRTSMEMEGWGDQAEQLHRLSMEQRWDRMPALVSDEMIHAYAAVGTYHDIAAAFKKRFAGINRLSFDIPLRTERDRGILSEILQDLRRP